MIAWFKTCWDIFTYLYWFWWLCNWYYQSLLFTYECRSLKV